MHNRIMKIYISLTITLVLLILTVTIPVTARYIDDTDLIDGTNISGITLVENSTDPTYYHIPRYSNIHYFDDGCVAIYHYNGQNYTYKNYIDTDYITFPADSVPKDIEVPSGSIVSPNVIIENTTFEEPWYYRGPRFGSDRTGLLIQPELEQRNMYVITYNNETILLVTWESMAVTNRSDSAAMITNKTVPEKWASGWVIAAFIEQISKTQTDYQTVGATWNVPNGPTTPNDQTKFFLFNGLTQTSNRIKPGYKSGIVQPVLAWNCGQIDAKTKACAKPATEYAWSGMAITQYVTDPPSPQIIGEKIKVNKGDEINGALIWSDALSQWQVIFYDSSTQKGSTVFSRNIVPNDSDYVTPILTLENPIKAPIPDLTPNICKDGRNKEKWLQGQIKFSKIIITDHTKDVTDQMLPVGAPNKDRFEDKEYNDFSCGEKSNYPRYDPYHYYINTYYWSGDKTITFQTHRS